MQEFGIVPRFRTGVHVGTIVAGEVGDDRREIVYIGNTMNTAARLQQACKELKQDVLVSGEFLKLLPPPPGIDAEDLGMIDLPGKSQRIHIFGLSRAATASNQQK